MAHKRTRHPYHLFSLSSPCPLPPQQTKVYQHSCHNTAEAHNKVVKCKEKVDASRGAARKKKAQEKEMEVKHFGRSVMTILVHPQPNCLFMTWLSLALTLFIQH